MEIKNNDHASQELSPEDTKAARDIVICGMVIGMIIPSAGQTFYNYLASEFANSHSLPSSAVRINLRGLGTMLYHEDWTLTISKNGQEITTRFEPKQDEQE